MAEIELVGLPFDGYGRAGNQALAADALRAAGLAQAFGNRRVSETRLELPAPDGRRGPDSGLMNEPALVAMTEQLAELVAGAVGAGAVGAGRFPVVVGGDCSMLLGIVGGLAAAVAVPGLGDAGVWLRDATEVAADPAGLGRAAAGHVAAVADAWWLHVDLDVLDPDVFPAQGLPGVPDDPGGLTREQLTELLVAALGVPGCVGWSAAIYDPEQDPDGSGAQHVVELAAAVADALG